MSVSISRLSVVANFAGRSKTFAWNLVLASTATAFLSGCGNSDSGSGRVGERSFDISSCAYKPSEGKAAKFSNLGQPQIVTSEYFEKKYDLADLQAVAAASLDQSVEYVKALNVTLFRVTEEQDPASPSKACDAFFGLQEAPERFQAKWTKASGGIKGGGLLGLYWDDCGFEGNCQNRKVVKPTVLINLRTDRWTLVHEMMHYNFDKTRRSDLSVETTTELLNSLFDSRDRLNALTKQFNTNPTQELARPMADELDLIVRALYRYLVRGQMEEVANEGTLVDLYYRGQYQFVPYQSAQNGVWYMEYSRKKSMEFLRDEEFQSQLNSLRSKSTAKQWPDVTAKIDAILKFQDDTDKVMVKQVQDAKTKVAEKKPVGTGRRQLANDTLNSRGLTMSDVDSWVDDEDPASRFRDMTDAEMALVEISRYNHVHLRTEFTEVLIKDSLKQMIPIR